MGKAKKPAAEPKKAEAKPKSPKKKAPVQTPGLGRRCAVCGTVTSEERCPVDGTHRDQMEEVIADG